MLFDQLILLNPIHFETNTETNPTCVLAELSKKKKKNIKNICQVLFHLLGDSLLENETGSGGGSAEALSTCTFAFLVLVFVHQAGKSSQLWTSVRAFVPAHTICMYLLIITDHWSSGTIPIRLVEALKKTGLRWTNCFLHSWLRTGEPVQTIWEL